jgi:hypothetical protein
VEQVKNDRLAPDHVRPYHEFLKAETLLGFLDVMRAKATWVEWEKDPEVHRIDDRIHVLLPPTFDGKTDTYTFLFLLEKDTWYFQQLEAISIRIVQVGTFPRRRSSPEAANLDRGYEVISKRCGMTEPAGRVGS